MLGVETDFTRRRWLSRAIAVMLGTIGTIMATVLGGAIVSPGLTKRRDNWVPAMPLDDLEDGLLKTVHVRTSRTDGYLEATDHQVVFLTRSGDQVTALSSVCTHLGCHVVWDAQQRVLKCPCHGGVFSATGQVEAGPPPKALESVRTRIQNGRVFVRI
jgi:menaquinol-cytochrome c reductase iron-sulfur subunit